MSNAPITVALTAEPVQLTTSTLSSLELSGTVSNVGTTLVDPEISASQLLVDGESILPWTLAIGNGPQDDRERALPPGETVTFRRVMGAALFRTTGTHELVLIVKGVRSAPVVVQLSA